MISYGKSVIGAGGYYLTIKSAHRPNAVWFDIVVGRVSSMSITLPKRHSISVYLYPLSTARYFGHSPLQFVHYAPCVDVDGGMNF